jgi:hypothetical protein
MGRYLMLLAVLAKGKIVIAHFESTDFHEGLTFNHMSAMFETAKPPAHLSSGTFFRQTTVRANVPPTRQGQTWFGESPRAA